MTKKNDSSEVDPYDLWMSSWTRYVHDQWLVWPQKLQESVVQGSLKNIATIHELCDGSGDLVRSSERFVNHLV